MIHASDVQFVSYAPGRARLKVKALRGSRELAQRVERELAAVKGMLGVEVNTVTGSMLAHFDEAVLRNRDAFSELRRTLEDLFPGIELDAIERKLRVELG